jgi:uncharacterized protein with FMN-binding domain
MRRAPYVIVATAAGMAGVLGFHTKTTSLSLSSTSPSSTSPSGTGTGTGTGTAATGTHSSGAHSGTASGKGAASGKGTASGKGAASGKGTAAAPTSGAASGSAASAVRSATGALEQYGYGQLAVRVTATGSKITNVTVTTIQVAESYSAQLAQQVIPMLRSEVLAAQSARINGISGASYTVTAYATSVQSALDKLHL